MKYETISLPEFRVIGISVRTTNQNGGAGKEIGALWKRFFNEGIMDQIPEKESGDIYCIYTDYETDFNGPYTTFLGCKVRSIGNIPEGLEAKTIPAATYQVYTSTGKLPDTVIATWKFIWQSGIERTYKADFDLYGSSLQETDQAVVKTFLSVK